MGLKRELHNPLTEEEASTLTKDEKVWLRSWNRHDEIPGEEPPAPEDAGDGEESDYDDMSIEELKTILRARDLPVSGNKDELIARLEEDDSEEE